MALNLIFHFHFSSLTKIDQIPLFLGGSSFILLNVGEVSNFASISFFEKYAFDLQKTSLFMLYQKVGGSNVPPPIPVISGKISTFQNRDVPHSLQNCVVTLFPDSVVYSNFFNSPDNNSTFSLLKKLIFQMLTQYLIDNIYSDKLKHVVLFQLFYSEHFHTHNHHDLKFYKT